MQTEKLRRRPLFRRARAERVMSSRAGKFELTRRDLDIIASIAKHRFMNTTQIVRLWGCGCPLVTKDGVRAGRPAKVEVKSHRPGCEWVCEGERCRGEHRESCVQLFKDNIHLASRLRELFQHGFLDRPLAQLYLRANPATGVIREGSAPMVYCPTSKGIEALGAERRAVVGLEKLSWVGKPNQGDRFYLAHTLAIGDVAVGVARAVRSTASLQQLNEAELCAGMSEKRQRSGKRWQLDVRHQGAAISTVCDLAFAIGDRERGRRYNFLCEVDMGTMTIWHEDLSRSSILRKLVGYARAQYDGLIESELGFGRMRVLFLTTSEARVQSMIDAARKKFGKAPEGRLFLFGTFDAAKDMLGHGFRDIDGKTVRLIKNVTSRAQPLLAEMIDDRPGPGTEEYSVWWGRAS